MADAAYRFQQPGASQYYYSQHNQHNQHPRHLARNGSPVNNNNRGVFANETPSPSRSPVSQSNPYNMYAQNHTQGQHMMMNGSTHQRYMQMGMGHKYQHQTHQQHHGQQNHHHQANHAGGHGGGVGHQHTFSSGTLSNSTPQFTPSNLHNGNSNGSQSLVNENLTPHWQTQVQLAIESRRAQPNAHYHCKEEGAVILAARNADETAKETPTEEGKEERNRGLPVGEVRRQDWDALDCCGQGMRALSRPLFSHFAFLKKLFLDHNRLSRLDPMIGQLRTLTYLNLSGNLLACLPVEIGMLVNLKDFLLFDNQLHVLPSEIGHLFKLEFLGIEGNPLDEQYKELIAQSGTKALITQIRETAEVPPAPNDRDWIEVDTSPASETTSVISYNILCDKYATISLYGYTPSQALAWTYRKSVILDEIKYHDADIVCLQEVDRENFEDFFRRELAVNDYKGVFYPKSRAKTMTEKEAKFVDGCAIFYKGKKYICLDKMLIDFGTIAINRPDMKGEHDTFNRIMPRDHIAVVAFLENRMTGSRVMVGNAHIYWDPAFADVKLVQVAILMEQIAMQAEKWAQMPPCTDKAVFRHSDVDGETKSDSADEPPPKPAPSVEYANGPQIPLIICGDFNSAAGTGVYDLITNGSLPGTHLDLADRGYGNFTRDGMYHPFKLKSAYADIGELKFTNYVPSFCGVLDYIWYSTNAMQVRGLLGDVDPEYLRKVPGFPNHHFPSDHLALKAEFSIKPPKPTKVLEEDGMHRDWERRN